MRLFGQLFVAAAASPAVFFSAKIAVALGGDLAYLLYSVAGMVTAGAGLAAATLREEWDA